MNGIDGSTTKSGVELYETVVAEAETESAFDKTHMRGVHETE